MDLTTIISFAAAGLCALLAVATMALKTRSVPWLLFALGMVLLAVDASLGGLIARSFSTEEILSWQRLRLGIVALVPGSWLAFSLCYSRGNYREFLRRWRPVLVLVYSIPVIAVLAFREDLISKAGLSEVNGDLFIGLGWSGKLIYLAMLLASVLILLNLERTFRSAVGIMRWRIKYFVLGAGLIFGAKLYISSQILLYSGIHRVLLQINGIVILGASLLMTYSLARTRLAESEIYPSHQVLQHSLTAVLAGVYLVCLGLLANWVAVLGGDAKFPLEALLLMIGIVGLTVLVLSDRVQQKTKLFIRRHFRRPVHDYQKVWSAFTERTGLELEPSGLCRAAAKSISETFELLSVTIWLVREHDKGLDLAASTSLNVEKREQVTFNSDEAQAVLDVVRGWTGPMDLGKVLDGAGSLPPTSIPTNAIKLLMDLNPDHFGKGGNRVCLPLISGGELIGLVTVADRVSGLQFSQEDLDLLKCIGDQLAGNLRNIQLARKLMQNKEMEAFQTMSAFFVHDLKNTASTLSLMLQNLTSHFGNPAFREDCLRSLDRSVTHITDLTKRLAMLRHELVLKKSDMDLNSLLGQTLGELDGLRGLSLVKDLQAVPKIQADAGQLQKVVTNLLLNAKEAVNGGGIVRVQTGQSNGWVVLSVADNGCGMSPEFVRGSLFRPFQTTKKHGLGIGMFHTKAIVEAHRGRIEVQSEVGQGTTIRVRLPMNVQ